MDRVIRCEGGFIVRVDRDDGVIAEIRQDMGDDHPALCEQVATEDLRGWIEVE